MWESTKFFNFTTESLHCLWSEGTTATPNHCQGLRLLILNNTKYRYNTIPL